MNVEDYPKSARLEPIAELAQLAMTQILLQCEEPRGATAREKQWLMAVDAERVGLWLVYYRMAPPH